MKDFKVADNRCLLMLFENIFSYEGMEVYFCNTLVTHIKTKGLTNRQRTFIETVLDDVTKNVIDDLTIKKKTKA